jgi:hypothetical protein
MYPNNDQWGAPPAPAPAPAGYGHQPGWGAPPPPTGPQPGWGAPQQQVAPPRAAAAPPDPDELMSGGHKAATFPDQQFGHVVGGPIVEKPVTTQQLDFDSRQPKFYDDGNPMWQIVVAVQAQPGAEDDDGIRAFYLKAQMKKAVQDAVRRAGATRLEVGGELHVRYIRDEPNSRGRGKPKKIYEARYAPPGGSTPAAPPRPTGPDPSVMAQLPTDQQAKLAGQYSSEPPF